MSILPPSFAELDPWAEIWNFPDIGSRYEQRKTSSMADLRAFYQAAVPRLEEMLVHLDGFEPGALPEPERRLYRLLCGLCEASAAVELIGAPCATLPQGHDVEYVTSLEPL